MCLKCIDDKKYCQNTQEARHDVKNTDKNRKNAPKRQKKSQFVLTFGKKVCILLCINLFLFRRLI